MKKETKPQNIFAWAFVPKKPIDWRLYIWRILGFIVGFIVIISLAAALTMNIQLTGFVSFVNRLAFFPMLLIARPEIFLPIILILAVAGAFAVMPRATLGRRGFLAAHWTSFFWIMAASGVLMLARKFHPTFWIIIPMMTIALIAAIIYYVSTARFASGLKFSNWKIALGFPFGWTWYHLTGYFLPSRDDKPIAIRFGWYDKLISFISETKLGMAAMAVIQVASCVLFLYPWTILLTALFAAAYIFKKKWSWSPMIVNLLFITAGIVLFEFFPEIPAGVIM